jgi:hypothetical protein
MSKLVRYGLLLLVVSLVGLSVFFASILHPIYMTLFWTPLLGISLGLNDVIQKLYGSTDSTANPAASLP